MRIARKIFFTLLASLFSGAVLAQPSLKMMIPANPACGLNVFGRCLRLPLDDHEPESLNV